MYYVTLDVNVDVIGLGAGGSVAFILTGIVARIGRLGIEQGQTGAIAISIVSEIHVDFPHVRPIDQIRIVVEEMVLHSRNNSVESTMNRLLST